MPKKKTISGSNILLSPIQYLPGMNVVRAELLRKELNISFFQDLLEHYPIRHVDKTHIDKIGNIPYGTEFVQVAGRLVDFHLTGQGRGRRLVAHLKDETGIMELVWFQGIQWVQKSLHVDKQYKVFGRIGYFMGKPQVAHPEMEIYTGEVQGKSFLEPVYPSTEKLKAKGLDGKSIGKYTVELLKKISVRDIPEIIPQEWIDKYKLENRFDAFIHIHFPATIQQYHQAVRRLKFEELFLAQLRIQMLRSARHRFSKGLVFDKVGDLFNIFFHHYLPFQLTEAQKRVVKEIRKDLGSGRQMNRLLQGDVGSGKTMVALLCMLLAADNGFQSVFMAPTEILAQQHFNSITNFLKDLPIEVEILTGSTSAKQRKKVLADAVDGKLNILIGTHSVIEDKVLFKNLGFAVVDEQHKFGVAQRALLWKKNIVPPHILVMTATPIPRTLALTAYGDLDYSVIDELPPGRKPISTIHRPENARSKVMEFIKEQITLGRQAYIIYPLIEESSKLDYENLMRGYEEVKSYFPEPVYRISMVHGRQPAQEKETNMRRFKEYDTQIMVSTTVIEVGVDIPNASVMMIESAEKFGLSQLHQLRGRVGRGADQSYCILLTGPKLSNDARERIKIMVATNDGFKIAEKDLEIRGPGEIDGTRQSGALQFKLASIVEDKAILEATRDAAELILSTDPELEKPENFPLKAHLVKQKGKSLWSKIA